MSEDNKHRSLKNDSYFEGSLNYAIAYCALIFSAILTVLIYPVEEAPLVFKFIGIVCLSFALIYLLTIIKRAIDKKNREQLIKEISKLLSK